MTSAPSNQSSSGFFNKEVSASYNERQRKTAPVIDNLHYLISIVLKKLPANAKILCVGVGTGTEIIKLAEIYPDWKFTGIDPSRDMLDVCRGELEKNGISERVELFRGYLSDFKTEEKYDAVLCLLVTQFVKDADKRQEMFNEMASRLNPKGYLINAELSDDIESPEFLDLLEKWKTFIMASGSTEEQVANILPMWKEHVSVVPASVIENFLRQAGFATPVQFFQSLVIHAWYSQKA